MAQLLDLFNFRNGYQDVSFRLLRSSLSHLSLQRLLSFTLFIFAGCFIITRAWLYQHLLQRPTSFVLHFGLPHFAIMLEHDLDIGGFATVSLLLQESFDILPLLQIL